MDDRGVHEEASGESVSCCVVTGIQVQVEQLHQELKEILGLSDEALVHKGINTMHLGLEILGLAYDDEKIVYIRVAQLFMGLFHLTAILGLDTHAILEHVLGEWTELGVGDEKREILLDIARAAAAMDANG